MPRDLLTELADAQAAQAAETTVIRLPLQLGQIPPSVAADLLPVPGCRCTWRPHYSTIPATWTRVSTDPDCRVHGQDGDETGRHR